jgi:serine/threonine protein phosphatase PrpC
MRRTAMLELDDDDTTPTENASVLRELAATLAAFPLGVVHWGAATSPGTRRRVNEDAWGHRGDVFVVADGMGGRSGGTMAARTAIDRFLERAERAGDRPDWRSIVDRVNTDVLAVAASRGIERVGTTLLAVAVGGPIVTLVHLGDSRAYRWSRTGTADRLDLLTHDHNVRAELLAAGMDVRDYRDRGVALQGLTSFIGLEHEVLRIDVLAVPVRAGDRILLCTDGVYRQLDDDRLRLALADAHPRRCAERLVAQADDAGGRDNATAVVLEVGLTNGEGARG